MMMLSYNLFLLFKFDSLDSSEYRQQVKTFRLKYVFLAEFIKYHCTKDEINDSSKVIERF